MRGGAEITFHDIPRLTGRFLLRYAELLRARLAYARPDDASAEDQEISFKASSTATM